MLHLTTSADVAAVTASMHCTSHSRRKSVLQHLLGMAMYWLIVCVSSGTAAAL